MIMIIIIMHSSMALTGIEPPTSTAAAHGDSAPMTSALTGRPPMRILLLACLSPFNHSTWRPFALRGAIALSMSPFSFGKTKQQRTLKKRIGPIKQIHSKIESVQNATASDTNSNSVKQVHLVFEVILVKECGRNSNVAEIVFSMLVVVASESCMQGEEEKCNHRGTCSSTVVDQLFVYHNIPFIISFQL